MKDFRERRAEADAPTETPAPVAEKPAAEPVADSVEKPDASAAGKALAAKKGSLQERINELTGEKYATAAERDAAKAELAATRAELTAMKAGKPAAAAEAAAAPESTRDKPKVEQFETLDAYFEAIADWKLEQRDAKIAGDAKKKSDADAATAADTSFKARAQSWIARRDAYAGTDPAFEDVAMPFLERMTAGTPVGDAIMDSEVGPQIALHLANHPDEATRIAALPWPAQIRAIGKIESKFDAVEAPVVKEAPVSRAPAPVKPPTSGSPEAAAAPDPKNITSVKAWRAERHKY